MIRLVGIGVMAIMIGATASAWAQPPAIAPMPPPNARGDNPSLRNGDLWTNAPASGSTGTASGFGAPAPYGSQTLTAQANSLPGYVPPNNANASTGRNLPGIGEPNNSYLDLDTYPTDPNVLYGREEWTWQLLPTNLIYKSYLAGLKESRFASQQVYIENDGWVWDAVLGARVGLVRFGNQDPVRPDGFQIDAEGSTQARLDITNDVDMRSADFRGGLPLTFGNGPFRTKIGYYHLSSHLGDEFLLAHPGYNRLNYSRDCIVAGETVFLTDRLRVYAEMAWAFHSDVSKPWEFQFGLDYSPVAPTGFKGAPFFAINGHLRQELNYSGNLVVEAGWAWMGDQNTHLVRMGFLYFNGMSNQYSFYNRFEQQFGIAVWYDY